MVDVNQIIRAVVIIYKTREVSILLFKMIL